MLFLSLQDNVAYKEEQVAKRLAQAERENATVYLQARCWTAGRCLFCALWVLAGLPLWRACILACTCAFACKDMCAHLSQLHSPCPP